MPTNPTATSPISYGPVPAATVFALPDPPPGPPAWHLQYASSPRRDLITSVAQRVSTLFMSGLAGRLLTNANIQSNAQRRFRHPTYRNSYDEDNDNHASTKQVDIYLKRRGVFELLEVDLVVGGFVCNKSPEGVHIQIEKVFKIEVNPSVKKSKQVTETVFDELRELQIEGVCPISELIDFPQDFSSSELLDQIPLGSQIKALVISVDSLTDVIYFSLNSSRLTPRQAHHNPLGLVTSSNDSTIPPASPFHHWRKSTWFNHPSQSIPDRLSPYPLPGSGPASSSSSGPSFVDRLKVHPLFKNPHGMTIMSKAYGIVDHSSLLPAHPCDHEDMHFNLRAAQNNAWAAKSVAKAQNYLQQDRLSDAVQYLTHAITVEPQFTEAYVCRGSVFLRLNQLDSAEKDFLHALDLDPENAEAFPYLQTIQEKRQKKDNSTGNRDDDDPDDLSEKSDSKKRRIGTISGTI